jgi:hypothetical protein
MRRACYAADPRWHCRSLRRLSTSLRDVLRCAAACGDSRPPLPGLTANGSVAEAWPGDRRESRQVRTFVQVQSRLRDPERSLAWQLQQTFRCSTGKLGARRRTVYVPPFLAACVGSTTLGGTRNMLRCAAVRRGVPSRSRRVDGAAHITCIGIPTAVSSCFAPIRLTSSARGANSRSQLGSSGRRLHTSVATSTGARRACSTLVANAPDNPTART